MSDSLKYNLIGIGVVIAMVVIYTVDNKIAKLIVGIGLVIGLIISLIQTQRSIELSDGQKRLSWIILLPLLSLIGYLYTLIK
jgi:disulfide bond formation protein DsbB